MALVMKKRRGVGIMRVKRIISMKIAVWHLLMSIIRLINLPLKRMS